MAVAKNSGRPGTMASGLRTYGTISSRGGLTQAVRPASAREAAVSFRNSRRLRPASRAAAWRGNRDLKSRSKSCASASSSRLRQAERLSPVAGGAARSAFNFILAYQPRPERFLRLVRPPSHVEDILARPDVPPGIAVALQAPFHLQRAGFRHHRHLVDAPVTG